jgi:maleamate amidohydrolase
VSASTANPHGAPFARRVGWGTSPALVVVDLVRAYVEPEGPFWLGSADVLGPAERLVGVARAAGVPVVWTVVRYAPDLADGGFFVLKVPALACFAEDAPGGWGELALPRVDGEPVLVKQHASAFAGTSLGATLRARGVDTVVVAGVSTSGCVRATATDALAAGFRPIVVADACADRSTALHEQNLADLDAKYADVVDLPTALDRLEDG